MKNSNVTLSKRLVPKHKNSPSVNPERQGSNVVDIEDFSDEFERGLAPRKSIVQGQNEYGLRYI
jgi:hypothetical protein